MRHKLRPRPKIEGVMYPVAAEKNKKLAGAGGGVPRPLRAGADQAMRRLASSRAAQRVMRDLRGDVEEGDY